MLLCKLTCSSLNLAAVAEACCAEITKCSPDFLSSESKLRRERRSQPREQLGSLALRELGFPSPEESLWSVVAVALIF